MQFFDAHLDMAMNALDHERDQRLAVARLREREQGTTGVWRGVATVSVDELRQGGCGVVLSTLIARSKPWVKPGRDDQHSGCDWPDPTMAYSIAMGQLAYYRLLESQGLLRIITTADQLKQHAEAWGQTPGNEPAGMILTMEGADPIVEPEQLYQWHELGLRTLMLAHFGKSHYAHGTPADNPDNPHEVDGPLTDAGRALLPIMHELGMPLDLTHTSDQSFAEAAELFEGRIYSSHTACRSLCDLPRNHSDDQLKLIIKRGGVIGLPFYNFFIKQSLALDAPKDAVCYADLADHIDHICQLAGNAKHVGIGSDCDGGFGSEHMPAELDTHRDIARLADALAGRGYSIGDVGAVLQGNWLRFFGETLR